VARRLCGGELLPSDLRSANGAPDGQLVTKRTSLTSVDRERQIDTFRSADVKQRLAGAVLVDLGGSGSVTADFRNRSASKRLDLPEALAPITTVRSRGEGANPENGR